jgi:hypothetical protein
MKQCEQVHASGCRLASFFWSFWIAAWSGLWVWATVRLQFPEAGSLEQRPLWHGVWVAAAVASYVGVAAARLQRRPAPRRPNG